MEPVNLEINGGHYMVALQPETGGEGFTVHCLQSYEMVTYGRTREEALAKIEEAIKRRHQQGRDLYEEQLRTRWAAGATRLSCSCKACGHLGAILQEEVTPAKETSKKKSGGEKTKPARKGRPRKSKAAETSG